MQTTMKLLLIAVLATLGQARAAALELLPAQSGDLSAAAVAPTRANVRAAAMANSNPANASEAVAPVSLTGAFPKVTREAVALSWATPDAATVAATPFVAQSKESYVSVTADELGAGVPLHTTSPRALVRVQAMSEVGPREQAAIHPLSMTVVDRGGRELSAGDGMEMIVSADKLAKAEVPFAAGTSAFRLDAALGAGDFKLKVDGASGGARYLVNVVEPDSPYTLTMQTAALHYLHGNELVLQSSLLQGDGASGARVRLTSLAGYVVSPAGRRFPVSFKPAAGGAMRATLTLDADETPVPGLWEVRAEASAQLKDQLVTRSVRLAFPVAMPVARLTRGVTLADGAGVNLNVAVEAAAAGRYEVRGMLYGTVNGKLAPLGVADSAQWLEAGQGQIALGFAPELIAGATGPFELRDLFLLDQGRLGVLHRQQRALVIGEDDVVRAGGRSAPKAVLGVPAAPTEAPHVKRPPNAAESRS